METITVILLFMNLGLAVSSLWLNRKVAAKIKQLQK
jgi:hypothetical protein